jgi:HEPN domain-containing protein
MIPGQIDEAFRKLGEKSEFDLAVMFLDYAEQDFRACSPLRSFQNKATAVFHLQQGVEKTAKAMLVLDHSREGLKRLGKRNIRNHNFLDLLQSSISLSDWFASKARLDSIATGKGIPDLEEIYADKGLFRYALEYGARELIELAKRGSKIYSVKSFEEIVQESGDNRIRFWNEQLRDRGLDESKNVVREYLKKEEIFVRVMTDKDALLTRARVDGKEISDLIKRIKELSVIDRVMPIPIFASIYEVAEIKRMRESMQLWAQTYVPILFLVLLTAPHVNCSRYPDSDIGVKIHEYESGSNLGIVEFFDVLLEEAVAIKNKISSRLLGLTKES